MWTIEELVARVHTALAAEYPGAPNGRVRDLPDRRAVRWYATTGLVDRPAAMRGRNALYGPRHLLQIVAVKRRQAAGRTLAEIQAELAGATETTLADIARVPEHLLVGTAVATVAETTPRTRFWAGAAPTAPATAALPAAPPVASGPATATATPDLSALTGVPLGGGVILLVPGRPDTDDCAAIATAARPLLELLAARRLHVPPTDGSSS